MFFVFFKDQATPEIYTYGHTLSRHDALPIYGRDPRNGAETCRAHGALLRRWFATYARLDDAGVTRFPLRAREPRDRWRIRWVFPMQGHAMLEERQTTIQSAPLQPDAAPEEIGKAPCREGGCQSGDNRGGAVTRK